MRKQEKNNNNPWPPRASVVCSCMYYDVCTLKTMLSSIITSNLQCSPRMGFPLSAIRLASSNSGPGVAGENERESKG